MLHVVKLASYLLLYSNKFSYLILDCDSKKKNHGAGGVVEYLGNFKRPYSVPAVIISIFMLSKFS